MTTLTAFYDLEFGPVSFDFVTWLVRAMKERDRAGCKRLHIVIVPKEDGLGGFSRHWGKHDEHATRWRLWHIVVAACPLAGATVTLAATRHQAHRHLAQEPFWWPEGKAHFMGPLVEAARRGESIPKLRATEAARRYVEQWMHGMDDEQECVTLTLRKQSTDSERNTSAAWFEFRDWLEAQGNAVIVLNDTHVELGRCPIGPFPALDVDLRLALYEQASMNMIGNNGPQELLEFSAAPYRAMGQALTDGWKDHFRRYFNLEPGEQFPWALPNQRLVYQPDTFDNLRAAFET